MKKSLSIIALLVAVLFALAGCAGAATPAASSEAASAAPTASAAPASEAPASEAAATEAASAEAAGGGYTIGAALISLNAPIWIELMDAGDECAAESNSTVIWKSAEGSLENQISLIEGFIEQKVNCIMIDPIDAIGLKPVIQESLNAGIPVITMGNLVEGGVNDELYNVCTTYPDVRDTSALTDMIIAAGGTDKTYIGVAGLTGNFVSDTRKQAFIDTCEAAGVKHLEADGNWDSTATLKVTQDMVAQAGADLGGLYNLDDSMCLISMQATPESLPVAGHNGEAAAFDKIDSGEMLCTILIGGRHIGYWNVLTAIKLCNGEKLEHQVYLKTYIVMTKENIDKYWTGKLDQKYPNLKAITPDEARAEAAKPAEMLDSLE